jgi:two-component system, cell cycle sensor histidine kinase and response regulator CckA
LDSDPPDNPDVLLVENNDTLRSVVTRVLEDAGYRVRTAPDPRTALKALHDGASRVPLIITDIRMDGMSGFAFAEELVRRYPTQRVLFISGHPDDWTLTLIHPLLRKPFDRATLLDEVRRLLDP